MSDSFITYYNFYYIINKTILVGTYSSTCTGDRPVGYCCFLSTSIISLVGKQGLGSTVCHQQFLSSEFSRELISNNYKYRRGNNRRTILLTSASRRIVKFLNTIHIIWVVEERKGGVNNSCSEVGG